MRAHLLFGLSADVVEQLRLRVREKTDALVCSLTGIAASEVPDAAERFISSHDQFHHLLRRQVQQHSLTNALQRRSRPPMTNKKPLPGYGVIFISCSGLIGCVC